MGQSITLKLSRLEYIIISLTKSHNLSQLLCKWLYISFIYLFVKLFIPHVVDGAARSPHQQGAHTKQGEHVQMREASGVGSQSNAPCRREVEQPCACNTTQTPVT